MMTNDERCILQALISELYTYTKHFPQASIPIDTDSWLETYDGIGSSGNGADDLTSKYNDVLRIASDTFKNYRFRLRFPEQEQNKISYVNKVWLEYTSSIFPDEQE
jgi:hypothetical protein